MTGEIFVIGDSHIGLAAGDDDGIVRWLDRLEPRRPAALYLNGDVFHYFIGDEKFRTESVRAVLDRTRRLCDSGTEVHYVEGNRDFFVKGSFAESSVTSVGNSYVLDVAGRRYFIIHGDMINDRDLPYRFWRSFSKNRFMKTIVKLTPRTAARTIVDRMERRLAKANFKHKMRLPVELMEKYGLARAEDGVDTVVLGHFHRKLLVPAGRATVAVLPPWFDEGEAMIISPETGEFRFEII